MIILLADGSEYITLLNTLHSWNEQMVKATERSYSFRKIPMGEFMELRVSLARSQEPVTGPSPEPDKSIPHSHRLFL
jgi:hypothetical protein